MGRGVRRRVRGERGREGREGEGRIGRERIVRKKRRHQDAKS